ncbi:MAG: L,D-transpeptidase [Alphaproteobacteria bacterium]
MFAFFGKCFRPLRAAKGALVTLAAILILTGGAQARSTDGPEHGRVVIQIDKSTQRMTVFVDGEKRHVFKVSTGKQGHATPSGSFRVLLMKEMHYSRKYDNAPMPNSLFFTNNGHAIHATGAVRNLGRPASHGCVRLAPRDAKALYDLVERSGKGSVTIKIS